VNYDDYLFHYTDHESGLSILYDKFLHPKLQKNIVNNEESYNVSYLTSRKPNESFEKIIKTLYAKNRYDNTKLYNRKVEFAIGIKYSDLLTKISEQKTDKLFDTRDSIDLRKFEIILVVTNFEKKSTNLTTGCIPIARKK